MFFAVPDIGLLPILRLECVTMLQCVKSGLNGTFWGAPACSVGPQHIASEAVNCDRPVIFDARVSSTHSSLPKHISSQANVIDFVSARRSLNKGAF